MNWLPPMFTRPLLHSLRGTALSLAALACAAGSRPGPARAEDWPMWGRTPARNMYTPEKNPPTEWDVAKNENVKWTASLGSKSYGNPVVANGIVYVGTNNEGPRDPAFTADAGVLMAFRESDGQFLWQRYSPKLATGRVNDWPGEGLCSTVYTEANRIWYCTNRCEVVCLDVSPSGDPPKAVWTTDMMALFGVFPHNMTSCSIVSHGDLIFVITGNGVDDTHKHVVAPKAPAIICFDKNTGKAKWTDNSPGENVLHGQWSSPALATVNGKTLLIAPLGDGWVYAYEAQTGKIAWKFDSNPKDSVYPQTRNELLATPVIYKNRMYIANGQDSEHGEGPGRLWCVDITKAGDVSAELAAEGQAKPTVGQELMAPEGAMKPKGKSNPNSGVVWQFSRVDGKPEGNYKLPARQRMNRTMATVAIDPTNGLVYSPDISGFLHCLDADTGAHYWTHDLEAVAWGSPLVCDGKVYQGDENGFVRVFKSGKEDEVIAEHEMGSSIYCSPVFANGTLYFITRDKLFAIGKK